MTSTQPNRASTAVFDNLLYTVMLASPTWGALMVTLYILFATRLSGLGLNRTLTQ